MRKQFVECDETYNVIDVCPWAAVITRVEGGYMCFESVEEHRIWFLQR